MTGGTHGIGATIAGAERLASEAEQVLGAADILVNNAGGAARSPGGIDTIPDTEWQAAVAANPLSAVRLDRLLVPRMRARGTGVAIHISSSMTRQPTGQLAHHAAAKSAPTNYAKALALDASPDGVRVNTVSPRMTMTSAVEGAPAMIAEAQGPDLETVEQMLLSQMGGIPLRRPGQPGEIAELAAFLPPTVRRGSPAGDFAIDGDMRKEV